MMKNSTGAPSHHTQQGPSDTCSRPLSEELDLLERFHLPVYLDAKYARAYGTEITQYSEIWLTTAAEVKRVYEQAYRAAGTASERTYILRSFTANFPDIACQHSDWLIGLWRRLRYEDTTEARHLLRAIGIGLTTPVYRLLKFQRQRKIEEAKKAYRSMLHGGKPLISCLRAIRDADNRWEAIESQRPQIVRCLRDLKCKLSAGEVLKRLRTDSPAHTLRMVIAAAYSVREADLGGKSALGISLRST